MFTLCANLIEKCIWSSAISCRFSAMLLFHFVRQAIHSSSLAWISGPATINKIQVAFFASRTKVVPAADALQGHKEGGKEGAMLVRDRGSNHYFYILNVRAFANAA